MGPDARLARAAMTPGPPIPRRIGVWWPVRAYARSPLAVPGEARQRWGEAAHVGTGQVFRFGLSTWARGSQGVLYIETAGGCHAVPIEELVTKGMEAIQLARTAPAEAPVPRAREVGAWTRPLSLPITPFGCLALLVAVQAASRREDLAEPILGLFDELRGRLRALLVEATVLTAAEAEAILAADVAVYDYASGPGSPADGGRPA